MHMRCISTLVGQKIRHQQRIKGFMEDTKVTSNEISETVAPSAIKLGHLLPILRRTPHAPAEVNAWLLLSDDNVVVMKPAADGEVGVG